MISKASNTFLNLSSLDFAVWVLVIDFRRIKKRAAKFGLNYGGAFSFKANGKTTALFTAHPERELTDTQISEIEDEFKVFLEEVSPSQKLSEREIEVLRSYAEGNTINEISEALGITASAAKERIASAKRKLKCRSTAHLIKTAVLDKLI